MLCCQQPHTGLDSFFDHNAIPQFSAQIVTAAMVARNDGGVEEEREPINGQERSWSKLGRPRL
ncbi:hypothetical protein TSUD_266080 [Trifolium subterraneum]|uniref:Uncharacterized protein n=1 Tax=Trifolium subterraneum TaxID=3900 RepID=A0A2Z6M0S0_TRISU|nr:hypothetical protein TSUD_266080 [Trifolium subterraneum]